MNHPMLWASILLLQTFAVHAESARPADLVDLDRPFDHYLWITTHNAANHGSVVPNQGMDISAQLQRGARGLMLDIYERDGQLVTCHADCAFHGRRAPLKNDLASVSRYLDDHPDAVVTLQLEDHYPREAMEAFVRENEHLFRRTFNPEHATWAAKKGQWPTLREMIVADQRLLIFTQRAELSGQYGGGVTTFLHDQDVTSENYWSLGDTIFTHDTSCRTRWDGIALDATDRPLGLPRLFVMNHFHGVPLSPHSGIDNRLDTVLERLDTACLPAAKRMPNYLAIDFIEWGDMLEFAETYNNGGLLAYASNGATGAPVCTFSTAFERAWSLVSAPRLGCENDSIRSLVFRGARAGQQITFYDAADGDIRSPYTVIDVVQDIPWHDPQPVGSLEARFDSAYLRVRPFNGGALDGRVSRIAVKPPTR
ncbi:phosphatidylinositol-specific phospholipase C domain-containing protein [Xanthomonas sp. 60]